MRSLPLPLKPDEREERRDAAYERGWRDSLRAHWNTNGQPFNEIYDYVSGWHACAKYRWEDPANHGRAPDPSFRTPRERTRSWPPSP